MKLYYSPGACSLSPHITLHESGLPHEAIAAPTKTKILPDGSSYLAINPLGYVPLLQLDDGRTLTEGPAIVQYIADQVPEKKLAPPNGSWERYQLQAWLNFIATEVHKSYVPLFSGASEEAKAAASARVLQRLGHAEKHLQGKSYLLGDDYSVADIYLFVVTNWAGFCGIDLSGLPNILALRERVAARPAVQAALAHEAGR